MFTPTLIPLLSFTSSHIWATSIGIGLRTNPGIEIGMFRRKIRSWGKKFALINAYLLMLGWSGLKIKHIYTCPKDVELGNRERSKLVE